jgi:helicase domain protein
VKDGYFKYDIVSEFLRKPSNVFRWKIYESNTLGKGSLLSWYAVILCECMEGNKTGPKPFVESRHLFYGATYLLESVADKMGLTHDLKQCFPDTYQKLLSTLRP